MCSTVARLLEDVPSGPIMVSRHLPSVYHAKTEGFVGPPPIPPLDPLRRNLRGSGMAALTDIVLAPGVLIARGVCRHLRALGFTAITEFAPARGLRVDVIALGPKGEIWIVECKSSRADFTSDRKWSGYREWSDRFFFAVDPDFPAEILPDDAGVILADPYDAEIARLPEATPLAGARRSALTRSFARAAATRLARLNDPDAPV